MKTMKAKLYGAFFAGAAAFAALILSACTFALDPVNAITDAFRFADTNVGILKVVNGAENGAILYGVQVVHPDKTVTEYAFETGLQPGNSREYRLPAQVTYNVKLSNGRGWTKDPQAVFFGKDETFTVTFTGTEEISIDLSGAKGKLTVFNSIPADKGEYVIQNLRVSSEEGGKENLIFYFYNENGIHKDEHPDFDVLPGKYWVRAQIKHPNGKLSKWSIPAHVGSYSSTDKDTVEISDNPDTITVSVNSGGIAVFNDKVLSGGNVQTDAKVPENGLLDDNGKETQNVTGSVDPGSKPVKAIKVEKLGFPDKDHDGVTKDPKYPYAQKDTAVQVGTIVRTTITVYDQPISGGGKWGLGLAEEGWYLLSFSTNGTTFSRTFPIRVSKNGNTWVVEPGVIPPFNEDDSTWTEKQGVVVNNDTPAAGGDIIKDGQKIGVLSPEDAQKPVTNIKIFNSDGSLYGHYRSQSGLPIYNGKEWIIFPLLPPGDYLVTLSDDSGATWTAPPYPFHVDGSKNGVINYDKTHPFWDTTTTGKPEPGRTSPNDIKWTSNTNMNWRPAIEIDPNTPIYIVVPSLGPGELADLADPNGDGKYDDMPSAQGSQLDIINLATSDLNVITYIKLNSFATPTKAYRIINVTSGIPKGKRLSLVGFDFTPGLYYVYLSDDGKTWQTYKPEVNIPAAWIPTGDGVTYASENGGVEVEKVIYRDGNWETLDSIYTDTDNDGFPDYWEKKYGYDHTNRDVPSKTGDTDEDGLNNWNEYLKGTDPTNPDTDGDGHPDGDDVDPLDPTRPGNNGGGDDGGGDDGGGDDGGGSDVPKKGFLVIENLVNNVNISSITIRRPYTNPETGNYLVDGNRTYNGLSVSIEYGKYLIFDIPISAEENGTDSPYQVKVTNAASTTVYYKATIEQNRFTFISFKGLEGGKGVIGDPIVVDDNTSGTVPGSPGGGGSGGGNRPPADDNDDITVITGGSGSGGLMQPGADPVGTYNTSESSGNLFDRNYSSAGKRLYPSGQVQPYLPNPSVPVEFSEGGDGTKQNMKGRGYFNFRFHYTEASKWGIGALSIQKLQRRGTSSVKDPVGPVIYLLNAKAPHDNAVDRKTGSSQARLGAISGSIEGENRSFNDWQGNWLGLRDSATGWQDNLLASGDLDPEQPVYRSGKGYYPDRTTAWTSGKSTVVAQREYGAHRALNNPGRLYTTGVIYKAPASSAITADPYVFDRKYAEPGEGFEAGEYRVYLRKGYDSLHKTADVGDAHQIKMYRYYLESFDITIYPGVVTTAIYRASLEKTDIKGAFAYTPIPQAAFGKIVVLNNPLNNDYTINAILLDKPGYSSTVNSSSVYEVHRYVAAMASTPSSMTGGTPNLLNGNSWGKMNPLLKGQMHTFILPPGGYRIAIQSTKQRDNTRVWYGEGSGTWLPVVVTEGDTVYLSYTGAELSR